MNTLNKLFFLTLLIICEPVLSGVTTPDISQLNTPLHQRSFSDSTSSQKSTCGNNQPAQQLAQLIQSYKSQKRPVLVCNEKLNEIALIKAKEILKSQDVWHNVGNMTPNQLLIHNGFKLPKTYPLFGNQVEAIAGGEESIELVFKKFLDSPPHRKLLLGEDEFFKFQDKIGVAYQRDLKSDHQHYWVVIIAEEKKQITEKALVDKAKPIPPIK